MLTPQQHVERMKRVNVKRNADGSGSLRQGRMKPCARAGRYLAMRCRFCGAIIGKIDTTTGPNASGIGRCVPCNETYAAAVCVDGDAVRMYQPSLAPEDFYDHARPSPPPRASASPSP